MLWNEVRHTVLLRSQVLGRANRQDQGLCSVEESVLTASILYVNR